MSYFVKLSIPALIAGVLLLFSISGIADTLVLKNGQVLQGTFKGGSDNTVTFEVDGAIQEIAVGEITSLTFSPRAAQTAAEQPASPPGTGAAAAAVEPGSEITVPAGTKIMIKTKEAVATSTHQKGAKFKNELETDLVVNGVVVAPKGTIVYGTVLESAGGRRIGVQRIVVTFTDLSINNQLVPIVTDDVGAEGGRGGAARAVGAGALIGAAAGDAGAGAAVGAGLALLAGGKHIQVPAETLVEVSLKQPLTIQK
jgi:hypothetical protein